MKRREKQKKKGKISPFESRVPKQQKKGKIFPFESRVPKFLIQRNKKAFLRDQCKEIEENTEWERLEISSRKLEISREHLRQRWVQKGQKWYGLNRSRRY